MFTIIGFAGAQIRSAFGLSERYRLLAILGCQKTFFRLGPFILRKLIYAPWDRSNSFFSSAWGRREAPYTNPLNGHLQDFLLSWTLLDDFYLIDVLAKFQYVARCDTLARIEQMMLHVIINFVFLSYSTWASPLHGPTSSTAHDSYIIHKREHVCLIVRKLHSS